MENPITPEEQQAMAEWRNSQKGEEKPDTSGVDATAVEASALEAPAVETPETTVPLPDASATPDAPSASSAPQNESLSQVTQSLKDAKQRLTAAMETGGKVSQQAAEMLTKENIKAVGKDFIDTLRTRAKESLQENVEAGKFNLALAKEMAKDAGQNLWQILQEHSKGPAFATLIAGFFALFYGAGILNMGIKFTPEHGNIINGLSNYMDQAYAGKAMVVTAGFYTGLTTLLAATWAKSTENIRNSKKEQA